MSKLLYRSNKGPSANKIGKILQRGSMGKLTDVPVDIPAIPGQRPTKREKLKDHMDKEGKDFGQPNALFNWALWSPPNVAKWYVDGKPVSKIYDGDHRRHMYALSHPDESMIPAWVVEVNDEAEAIDCFIKSQSTRRTSLSPEDLFICNWHKKKPEALELGKVLKECGLRVASDPEIMDPQHSVPPSSAKPAVPVAAFKRCVAMCRDKKSGVLDTGPLKYANSFFASFGCDESYTSEEYQGMVALAYFFPKAVSNKKWESYVRGRLGDMFEMEGSRKSAFSRYKVLGGDVHRKAAQSIARGIADRLVGMTSCPEDLGKYLKNKTIRSKLKK
jgi:hypothetical protein